MDTTLTAFKEGDRVIYLGGNKGAADDWIGRLATVDEVYPDFAVLDWDHYGPGGASLENLKLLHSPGDGEEDDEEEEEDVFSSDILRLADEAGRIRSEIDAATRVVDAIDELVAAYAAWEALDDDS